MTAASKKPCCLGKLRASGAFLPASFLLHCPRLQREKQGTGTSMGPRRPPEMAPPGLPGPTYCVRL